MVKRSRGRKIYSKKRNSKKRNSKKRYTKKRYTKKNRLRGSAEKNRLRGGAENEEISVAHMWESSDDEDEVRRNELKQKMQQSINNTIDMISGLTSSKKLELKRSTNNFESLRRDIIPIAKRLDVDTSKIESLINSMPQEWTRKRSSPSITEQSLLENSSDESEMSDKEEERKQVTDDSAPPPITEKSSSDEDEVRRNELKQKMQQSINNTIDMISGLTSSKKLELKRSTNNFESLRRDIIPIAKSLGINTKSIETLIDRIIERRDVSEKSDAEESMEDKISIWISQRDNHLENCARRRCPPESYLYKNPDTDIDIVLQVLEREAKKGTNVYLELDDVHGRLTGRHIPLNKKMHLLLITSRGGGSRYGWLTSNASKRYNILNSMKQYLDDNGYNNLFDDEGCLTKIGELLLFNLLFIIIDFESENYNLVSAMKESRDPGSGKIIKEFINFFPYSMLKLYKPEEIINDTIFSFDAKMLRTHGNRDWGVNILYTNEDQTKLKALKL